jgi:VanZ family protein
LIGTDRSRHTLLALYAVALLAVTLAPTPLTTSSPPGLDKLAHAAMFGGLAFLMYWNMARSRARAAAAAAFLLSVAAAGFIELVQHPLPHRSADTWDLAAGAVGSLLGIAVFTGLSRGVRRPRRPQD